MKQLLKVLSALFCCEKEEHTPKPRPTPLPKGKVAVIGAVVFVSQFGLMMIFPFLPFMIHDFFPELSRQELGRKAGFLGSAFFVGSFTGSLMWGWLSDLLGRRPVMLFGVCGTIGSELFFGFSQSFAWALAARFLWGFLNGNIGVAKTYLSEICDDSNQAKGFAVIGTAEGLGRLTGSIIGGFLAQPASKYSLLQVPFFCKFPYILPCLVGVAIGIMSFIGAFFFLDETLHTKIKNRQRLSSRSDASSDSDRLLPSLDSGIEMSRQGEVTEAADESDVKLLVPSETIQIVESDIDSQSDFETVSSDTELLLEERRAEVRFQNELGHLGRAKRKLLSYRQQCKSCVTCCLECTPRKACTLLGTKLRAGGSKLKMMLCLIRDRRVIISTSLYGMLAFGSIIIQEIFPLLMVTDYKHGGYSLDDNEIGVALMTAAVFQLVWQLLAYSKIAKCLGYRKTLQVGAVMFAVACALLPLSNKITGPVGRTNLSPPINTTGPANASMPDYWTDSVALLNITGLSNGSTPDDLWSGSGVESSVNETIAANSTDYCGNDVSEEESLVNENSIKRIPWYVWIVLSLLLGFLVISRISSFISVMVLINNSALPETRGTVNGIGQSLAACGRAVGPVIGSTLFAWSESSGLGWPLNYHFTFYICILVSFLIVGLTFGLPKTSKKKRDTIERAS